MSPLLTVVLLFQHRRSLLTHNLFPSRKLKIFGYVNYFNTLQFHTACRIKMNCKCQKMDENHLVNVVFLLKSFIQDFQAVRQLVATLSVSSELQLFPSHICHISSKSINVSLLIGPFLYTNVVLTFNINASMSLKQGFTCHTGEFKIIFHKKYLNQLDLRLFNKGYKNHNVDLGI